MACDFGSIEFQRRNANALPLFQPVLAVGALAIDAQLAFADDALDVRERQAGKARLEKAIDAHVVLVSGHDDGLNFCRQRRRLDDNLLGLGDERRRLRNAGRGKPRRRLAAGAMRGRPLGLRATIRARAFWPIARWAKWSPDATAHDVFPLLSFAQ